MDYVNPKTGSPGEFEAVDTSNLKGAGKDNYDSFEGAKTGANTQIDNMKASYDRMMSGNADDKKLYEAAFGTKADPKEVGKTIGKLQSDTFKVQLKTNPSKGTAGYVKIGDDGKPEPGRFTKVFHGTSGTTGDLTSAGRAGTLIHEASHYVANTGDEIKADGKQISTTKGADIRTDIDGYQSPLAGGEYHKTVKAVNADEKYTGIRDKVENMHANADSYALYGSLCSNPNALSRRDLEIFARAFEDGDEEELVRRAASCKLPPDYFAKKAAEKKAATAKTTPGTKTEAKGLSKAANARSPGPIKGAKVLATGGKEALKKGGAKTTTKGQTRAGPATGAKAGLKGKLAKTLGGKQTTGPKKPLNAAKGITKTAVRAGGKKPLNAAKGIAKTAVRAGGKKPVGATRKAGATQARGTTKTPTRVGAKKPVGGIDRKATQGRKPTGAQGTKTPARAGAKGPAKGPKTPAVAVARKPSPKAGAQGRQQTAPRKNPVLATAKKPVQAAPKKPVQAAAKKPVQAAAKKPVLAAAKKVLPIVAKKIVR